MAYRLLGFRLGPLSLAAFALAGCFPDPVNMRPTVQIDAPAEPVFKGQPATYTARRLDGDGDTLTLVWHSEAGDCPGNFKLPEAWPRRWEETKPTLKVESPLTQKPYCVWAKVTDSHGAADVDTRHEVPGNHAPVVSVEISNTDKMRREPDRTYPLRTRFMMSGANTMDVDAGDPRNFAWSLRAPTGSNAVIDKCPEDMDPALNCFTADVDGDYVARLTFSDGTDSVVKDSETITVTRGPLPVAVITIASPKMSLASTTGQAPSPDAVPRFPLGTEFKFSAKTSFSSEPLDPAGLMFTWGADFSKATGTTAMRGLCADDMSPSLTCFTGDVPGTYRVTLVAVDGPVMSKPVFQDVEVLSDAMPCLGMTDPVRDTKATVPASVDDGRDFTIGTVDDDLDPFPPKTSFKNATRFDWFVSKAGGPFMLSQSGASNAYHLSNVGVRLGDEALVRVQIRDRDTERSQLQFEKCDSAGDKATCSVGETTCFQRWTWKVKFGQ